MAKAACANKEKYIISTGYGILDSIGAPIHVSKCGRRGAFVRIYDKNGLPVDFHLIEENNYNRKLQMRVVHYGNERMIKLFEQGEQEVLAIEKDVLKLLKIYTSKL